MVCERCGQKKRFSPFSHEVVCGCGIVAKDKVEEIKKPSAIAKIIQTVDIQALAEFLDEISDTSECPWSVWFDETYCQKCPTVKEKGPSSFDPDIIVVKEYAQCELGDCPFGVKDLDMVDIIKLWLQSTYSA